jgi:hypothetical protein
MFKKGAYVKINKHRNNLYKLGNMQKLRRLNRQFNENLLYIVKFLVNPIRFLIRAKIN